MKKSGKDRLKQAIIECTLSTADAFPLPLEGKAGDTRETCHPQTFWHRPIYICGEAATTTLNPKPRTLKSCQAKPLDKSIFLLYNSIRCGDELCLLKTS